MLKKILQTLVKLFKFLWKLFKFIAIVFFALILIYGIVTSFREAPSDFIEKGGGKKHFIENKSTFEKIAKRFDEQDKISKITIDKSSGKLKILNSFSIGPQGEIKTEKISGDLKKKIIKTEITRLLSLNELYNYYGTTKEEIQWYIDNLRNLGYEGLYKYIDIWCEGCDKPAKGIDFSRSYGGVLGTGYGLIYNPENKISLLKPHSQLKLFEKITDDWYLYET